MRSENFDVFMIADPVPEKTSPDSPQVLILGGGVCGLYAALTLLQKGIGVTVLEKEERPGGLAAGHECNGNFYDLGCHMLHAHDEGVFDTIKGIMGDERIEVQLDAKIRWMGNFYRYPLQFQDMVKGMSLMKLGWYGSALVVSQIWYKCFPREPKDAEEALIMLYGKPLYQFFFRDFTHRYWGISPRELSATFIKSKMPRLSAVDIVKKALAKVGVKEDEHMAVESALLEETLHYSHTGAETMPRLMSNEVERLGGKILLNHTVKTVEMSDGKVTGVTCENGEAFEADYFISTMPIPLMAKSMTPSPAQEVMDAATNLRYKPIAIYGVLVKQVKCIDALYIYYRRRIFHRVGEPKNAGLKVTPEGHTVLIVEMTCDKGDGKWVGDPDIWDQIVADLETENICKSEDIVEHHILRSETGYPIFELGFEPYFEMLKNYVDDIPNLWTTGRQGGFCYPNMHKAMRMGADAADEVIQLTGKT